MSVRKIPSWSNYQPYPTIHFMAAPSASYSSLAARASYRATQSAAMPRLFRLHRPAVTAANIIQAASSSVLAPSQHHQHFSTNQCHRSSPGPYKPRSPPRPTPATVDRDNNRHRHQYNRDPFSLNPPEEHKHFPLVSADTLAAFNTRPTSCRMLTRDFIHDSLYNPHYGYFSRHAVLLPDMEGQQGEREATFEGIKDEEDFMRKVEESYIEFERQFIQSQSPQAPEPPPTTPTTTTTTPPSSSSRPSAVTAADPDAAKREGRAAYLRSKQVAKQHDGDVTSMVARQVWHTPTQLFKPHYANIIAQHCIDANQDGQPLVIYEIGAGSGAMADCILNYVQERYPNVYASIQYHIIEISDRLADQQSNKISQHLSNGKAFIHRQNILEWDTVVPQQCFILALEVLDNLPHDVLRYSTNDSTPYQCYVSIDSTGDMHELFAQVTDPLIKEYLFLYRQLRPEAEAPALSHRLTSLPTSLRNFVTTAVPLFPNLSQPHFIPTGSLRLLQTLHRFFPKHRPVFSDFHALPKDASVKGLNGPVVQTRVGGKVIDVSTYAVLQGYFDIFFPTDFQLLKDFYGKMATSQKPQMGGEEDSLDVVSHRAFLERYPDLARGCQLRDGSNPMLSWYQNASWLIG